MRWREPQNGDTKIETAFLLLPVTIKDETRWLERATIKYEYSTNPWCPGWRTVEFIDK